MKNRYGKSSGKRSENRPRTPGKLGARKMPRHYMGAFLGSWIPAGIPSMMYIIESGCLLGFVRGLYNGFCESFRGRKRSECRLCHFVRKGFELGTGRIHEGAVFYLERDLVRMIAASNDGSFRFVFRELVHGQKWFSGFGNGRWRYGF